MTWHDIVSRPVTYTLVILLVLIVITYDYQNSTFVTAILKAVILAPSYYFAAAAFVLVAGKYYRQKVKERRTLPVREVISIPAPRQQDLPTPVDQPSNAFSVYTTPPLPQYRRFVTLEDLEKSSSR